MQDFETHPRGTGEVLRQLRAEREAMEVRCVEQRALLERSFLSLHSAQVARGSNRKTQLMEDIHQHLESTQ